MAKKQDTIDRNTPIPLYYQLQQLLLEQIRQGVYKEGETIPSELELCRRYGLSRTTVRQAVGELVHQGVLSRVKGKGVFVAKPKLTERFVQEPIGFYEEMRLKDIPVKTEVLEQGTVLPPAEVAEILGLAPEEEVVLIKRRRAVKDNEWILIVTSYLPSRLFPGLEREDVSQGSLYELLSQKYNLYPYRSVRTIEAVAATRQDAELLQVKVGTPLLLLRSTAYLQDGTAFEHFVAKHRGDKTRFEIESYTRRTY